MSRGESHPNPSASSAAAKNRMKANRGRDTAPELALRSALHRRGLRYRVDRQVIPGLRRRADLVFGPSKVAVFVDGCYWHGCPEHGTWPKANAQFWRQKIEANKRRDAETTGLLEEAGWRVLRFWAHEAPEHVADAVETLVRHSVEPAT